MATATLAHSAMPVFAPIGGSGPPASAHARQTPRARHHLAPLQVPLLPAALLDQPPSFSLPPTSPHSPTRPLRSSKSTFSLRSLRRPSNRLAAPPPAAAPPALPAPPSSWSSSAPFCNAWASHSVAALPLSLTRSAPPRDNAASSPPSFAPSPVSAENAHKPSLPVLAAKRSRSSFQDMATAAKNFFHGIGHGSHHPHLPRSNTHKHNSKGSLSDPEYLRRKEEDKHLIATWDDISSKTPLTPSEICQPANKKRVGHSSKSLERKDFKLIKTIGTGTFARVWLAKLAQPQAGDEDKVFALKILRKVDIIKLKQVEHVRSERTVLAAVAGHPFITTMVASFQDADNLYMILDYCPGGEIFTYLRRNRRFEEDTTRFYAAEIVLILEFLHEREGVAYRDLKPENILIDAEGHIKLVDFGFAKKLDGKSTWTLCGTPEYLAPETIKNTGHGPPVDWWAFGILLYEFLVGQPPFWDENPMKIYEQISDGNIHYPNGMSEEAQDLIARLCEVNPAKRLGSGPHGSKDIRNHAFFKDVDWDKVYRREANGPIIPHLRGHDDTRNFEEYEFEPERKTVYTPDLRKKYDGMFESF